MENLDNLDKAIQETMELAGKIETEVYYGFNLKTVFVDMALNNPEQFEAVQKAFEKVRLEREAAMERTRARKGA